jgi:GDP-L-fucose synthase
MRRLEQAADTVVLTATRNELDLRDQSAVECWFAEHQPTHVYLVAGTVGGIQANATRPAEFIYDNLMIHSTVVHAAHTHGVDKLLYLGSSCIYPRQAMQPITEDQLLTGPLEPTNEPYAIAKIAGIKLCDAYRHQYGSNFISAMPTNLYGPGDNFDLEGGHVMPMLMRKFHEAKLRGDREVVIWGTGSPLREFLHVDDLADACVFLMDHYDADGHVNVGTGSDVSIRQLAETLRDLIHPGAELIFDTTKPDGTPRKVLDISVLASLGWKPKTPLHDGIQSTYTWFQSHYRNGTLRL